MSYFPTPVNRLGFSMARIAPGGSPLSLAGSFSTGGKFSPTRPCSCSGIRFYWVVSTTKTVKVTLWTDGGSSLATANQTVAATGLFETLFTTPISLTAGTLYRVGAWQNDGLNYTKENGPNFTFPTFPFFTGDMYTLHNHNFFVAGDAMPTTAAISEVYGVDPILNV